MVYSQEDYYSQQNSALRKWFEVIDFDLREQIKKEWIADMERLHISIPFFKWFPTFASKHGISKVYSHSSLEIQSNLFNIWSTVKLNTSLKNDSASTSFNAILLNKIQLQLEALSQESSSSPSCINKTYNQNLNT